MANDYWEQFNRAREERTKALEEERTKALEEERTKALEEEARRLLEAAAQREQLEREEQAKKADRQLIEQRVQDIRNMESNYRAFRDRIVAEVVDILKEIERNEPQVRAARDKRIKVQYSQGDEYRSGSPWPPPALSSGSQWIPGALSWEYAECRCKISTWHRTQSPTSRLTEVHLDWGDQIEHSLETAIQFAKSQGRWRSWPFFWRIPDSVTGDAYRRATIGISIDPSDNTATYITGWPSVAVHSTPFPALVIAITYAADIYYEYRKGRHYNRPTSPPEPEQRYGDD